MWSLPDWCEPYPDCAIGVGKKMNVSLETLRDDVPRPKWAHFGPRKNSDTAAMAQEILNSPEYKALEQNSEELPFAESAAEAVEETAVEAESLEVNASEPAVEEVKLSEKTEEPVLKGCASEKASEIVTKGKEAVVSEKAEVVAAEGQAGAGAPEETKESAPKEEMVKSEESLPVEGWIKAAEGIEEFVTKEQTEDLKEPEKSGETTTTINSEVKTPEPEKK
jgi:hypothetical protein